MSRVHTPVFWLLNGPVQFILYLAFVLGFGWMLAVKRVIGDILWPALAFQYLEEQVVIPDEKRLTNGVIVGEYLYATLSVVSKMFLLVFFITSFENQNW